MFTGESYRYRRSKLMESVLIVKGYLLNKMNWELLVKKYSTVIFPSFIYWFYSAEKTIP